MAKTTTTTPPPVQPVDPSQWRRIADSELPEAIAELSKHVTKKEASSPAMVRRLARRLDGAFLLTLNVPPPTLSVWNPRDGAGSVTMAFRIPDALALLKRADGGPEAELVRRREAVAKFQAKELEKRRATKDAEAATKAAKAKAADEAKRFHSAEWSALPAPLRTMLRLALVVEKRDAELAADLRLAVAASLRADDASDFPRAPWWEGIDLTAVPKVLTVEEQRDQVTLSEIPPDKLVLLKVLCGDVPAAIAKRWREIQERRA